MATTVHELQVRAAAVVPTTKHNAHVDLIVTPDRVIRCARSRDHLLPQLDWDELTVEKIASIPVLGVLREAAR